MAEKSKLVMEEGRDQHLFAKPVQIIQAVVSNQRLDLCQSEEKPVPSPERI